MRYWLNKPANVRNGYFLALVVAALIGAAMLFAACGGPSNATAQKQRQQAIQQRVDEYAKAIAQVPTPNVTNFPRRQTLADAVKRQSLPDHPWYVYVLGMNGNIEYYFVAKSVPVNDCDYLSSTQNVQEFGGDNGGLAVLDSPSLEGIYQSSSGCNTLTFFDLGTNAEVQVNAGQSIILDAPLKVDAQPIKVKSAGK